MKEVWYTVHNGVLQHKQPQSEGTHATDVGHMNALKTYIQANEETAHNQVLQCLLSRIAITTRN